MQSVIKLCLLNNVLKNGVLQKHPLECNVFQKQEGGLHFYTIVYRGHIRIRRSLSVLKIVSIIVIEVDIKASFTAMRLYHCKVALLVLDVSVVYFLFNQKQFCSNSTMPFSSGIRSAICGVFTSEEVLLSSNSFAYCAQEDNFILDLDN